MVSAQVVLARDKHRRHVEITLHARGEKFLHAVAETEAWEASLSEAMEKIGGQALKVKGKWREHARQPARGVEAPSDPDTCRVSTMTASSPSLTVRALLDGRADAVGLALDRRGPWWRPRSAHHQPLYPEDRFSPGQLPRVPSRPGRVFVFGQSEVRYLESLDSSDRRATDSAPHRLQPALFADRHRGATRRKS